MSDSVETTPPAIATTTAPAAAPPPPKVAVTPAVAPPASAPAPEAKPPKSVIDDNPVWLSERLKRERLTALRAVGAKVGKNADPDAVAAEIKAKNDSRKSKLKATRQELEAANAKTTQLEQSQAAAAATIKIYAETELAALNDKQRDFVKLTAGDDVAKQLETISMLKSQGVLMDAPAAATSATPPATPAAPATIDAPASTSPASPAPTPASPQATDIRAEYRNLKSVSPYLAAQFILNHPELLNPS